MNVRKERVYDGCFIYKLFWLFCFTGKSKGIRKGIKRYQKRYQKGIELNQKG